MDDLYSIIGCSRDASTEEIKSLVKQARLRLHPDKNTSASHQHFLALEKAWNVLKSPEARRAYDSAYSQQELMKDSAGQPVQADLRLEELHFEPGATVDRDSSLLGVYWTECRCGGTYFIDSVAVLCKAKFIQCTDCSLVIRIIYPEEG